MISDSSRRNFLKGAAALGAAAAAAPSASAAPAGAEAGIKLGVASYSFREFSRHLAIQYMKTLKAQYINIKEFHLPINASAAETERGAAEFRRAGLTITGAGTIYMQKDDDADLRKNYEYCKAAGIPMIVGSPSLETLAKCDRLCQEYNIKLAIHNHGPEDKHWPSPLDILKAIRSTSPMVGLCIDVGHTTRTGTDVLEAIRAAGPRLFDLHIKDLANLMDAKSQVDVGDGVMPIAAIFSELMKMNYQGHVMLEYEINMDNPMPGMIRSFAYMRGVLAGLNFRKA
jgi:sugar phosphate isomerase/epimerase